MGIEAERRIVAVGVKAHDGAKETLSPVTDIPVSSNLEQLLWFLAYENASSGSVDERRKEAGEKVKDWLSKPKSTGGFKVSAAIFVVRAHNL